ncbi:hypothetical protein [Burkholderia ubonensis]|nr:hypothetical protein [Burkholderia ubonensis]
MKRYAVGLMLGLTALGAMAQEVSSEVKAEQAAPSVQAQPAVAPVAQASSAGAPVTEQNPLKQEFLAKSSSKPALFRPSENIPEIVNEDVLRGMSESGKKPGRSSDIIGYMPKLKVLPCAKGCEGKDYDRAVKEFIKGYTGNGKQFKERGEMIVQVRWYNTRPFLMRQLPYSADVFGVSFMLEGKVVSLGMKSGVGMSISSYELAKDLGARLAAELAFTLGMGVKPTYVSTTNNASAGVGGAIMTTGAKVDGLLGVDDVRPRIEPATEANNNLLPAIDGILPNEVEPITEMHYINSLMF